MNSKIRIEDNVDLFIYPKLNIYVKNLPCTRHCEQKTRPLFHWVSSREGETLWSFQPLSNSVSQKFFEKTSLLIAKYPPFIESLL